MIKFNTIVDIQQQTRLAIDNDFATICVLDMGDTKLPYSLINKLDN